MILIKIVRPTEIPESDVYVCESTYDESKKQIRRNVQGQGLRKFTHSQLVTPDEVYHFKNAVIPIKVGIMLFQKVYPNVNKSFDFNCRWVQLK